MFSVGYKKESYRAFLFIYLFFTRKWRFVNTKMKRMYTYTDANITQQEKKKKKKRLG